MNTIQMALIKAYDEKLRIISIGLIRCGRIAAAYRVNMTRCYLRQGYSVNDAIAKADEIIKKFTER